MNTDKNNWEATMFQLYYNILFIYNSTLTDNNLATLSNTVM